MSLQWLSNLVGTLKSSFNVGKAKIDASGVTAARTQSLPDKAGTFAMLDDIEGGIAWEETDGSSTLSVNTAYRATDDVTLPGTVAENNWLKIHANGVDIICIPNGVDIRGPFGTVDGDTDTLKLFNGETVHLVANSSSQWEAV